METFIILCSSAVNISIDEEHIPIKICTIIKNSKDEHNFIAKLINSIKRHYTESLMNKDDLNRKV